MFQFGTDGSKFRHSFIAVGLLPLFVAALFGQTSLKVESPSFQGRLHDNISNQQRQGSGFTPLSVKPFAQQNLYRDDAVGLNFEHIFNGAEAEYDISMFTPRKDRCQLRRVKAHQYELSWPARDSRWSIDARMFYDLSHQGQIDLTFACTPKKDIFPHKYVAMMWASYMNRARDRKIRFWGKDGSRTGWVEFGVGTGNEIEVGTVAHHGTPDLRHDVNAQTLNVVEHPRKRFITPFYYGLIDADHDLTTHDDTLLYLVLFDQTDAIRFAMWNFIRDEHGNPDTHSPAWDWQYVIREPKVDQRYGYRARVVVEPYTGVDQVWNAYRRWTQEVDTELPPVPESETSLAQ